MTTPRISVVVPVRDGAPYLGLCLAALARQDVQPDEVVVVGSGESELVAQAAGARFLPRQGPGIAAAAAAGYDACSGDLIARLEADSMPPVNWLREIRGAFALDPALAAVTGRGVFADLSPARRLIASAGYHGAYFGVLGIALGQVPLYGSNFAMRRAVWQDVRGAVHSADPAVHDDLDLTMRLGRSRRVRFEPRLAVAISTRAVTSVPRLTRSGVRTWHTIHRNGDRLRETRIGRLVSPGFGVGPLGALAAAVTGIGRG
ncbi:glycosyltransferase family 2 protein [Amnibacterium endophyticum]|uniref:4,4'-diaponeurosporenoate glycosyltransferase n=1 Tax=Amnibacterium endophyticum TaxID=2109337 RepID=A0ABW4LGG3_9MICO